MQTNFTEAEVRALPWIHSFRNEWRNRHVAIHAHPTDPDKVVTMGYAINEFGGLGAAPPVICIEQRKEYARIIERKIARVQ